MESVLILRPKYHETRRLGPKTSGLNNGTALYRVVLIAEPPYIEWS